MSWLKFLPLVILLFLFCCENNFAQEGENKLAEGNEKFSPQHSIGLVIGHAHVFDGRDESGNRKVLTLPAWGIDYTYHFPSKWTIGLHTGLIVEKFEVEKNLSTERGVIERSYPIAPAAMAIYKPTSHWNFFLGAGVEFEKEENFFLTRAGVEYSAELPKEWEVFGSLSYDFKWNAYDTWVLGIGIAKSFGKKSK